jgi:hypothetical protein
MDCAVAIYGIQAAWHCCSKAEVMAALGLASQAGRQQEEEQEGKQGKQRDKQQQPQKKDQKQAQPQDQVG